jgi:hypothetical protein
MGIGGEARRTDKIRIEVVVKPRKGYGSVNTAVIKSQQDLEKYLGANFLSACDAPIDMIVESFVTGHMYHVDGFVYNGEVSFILRMQRFREKGN